MAVNFKSIDNYQPSLEIKNRLRDRYFAGFVGPSAIGKNVLMEAMTDEGQSYTFSRVVSGTNRLPRDGEIDGQDYHFSSSDSVEQILEKGPVQLAQHPTLDNTYYWSDVSEWIKTDIALMDVLTDEYDKLKYLPYMGSLALMVVAEPEDWRTRFNERSDQLPESAVWARLNEAKKSLIWGLEQRHSVAWVNNRQGELQDTADRVSSMLISQRNIAAIAGEHYNPSHIEGFDNHAPAQRLLLSVLEEISNRRLIMGLDY